MESLPSEFVKTLPADAKMTVSRKTNEFNGFTVRPTPAESVKMSKIRPISSKEI